MMDSFFFVINEFRLYKIRALRYNIANLRGDSMDARKKNWEKSFYEKIGVRKLKEFILKCTLFLPKTDSRDKTSYFLKSGNGLQDLKDHKKYLWFNGLCHGTAFIAFLCSPMPIFLLVPLLLSQAYLVMIQRYNYIRIKDAVEKHQGHEQKKIKNLKIYILEKDNSLRLHKVELYKYRLGRYIKLSESLDDILNQASYLELLYYKKLFDQLDRGNQEECWYSEEFDVPSLDGHTFNKTLFLNYDISKNTEVEK